MSSNNNNCNEYTVDFIIKEKDVAMQSVEDDIARHLKEIGITVNTKTLTSEEYGEEEKNGDYHILFTRTWGAPYDPHSYLSAWDSKYSVSCPCLLFLSVCLQSCDQWQWQWIV